MFVRTMKTSGVLPTQHCVHNQNETDVKDILMYSYSIKRWVGGYLSKIKAITMCTHLGTQTDI